MLTAKPTVAYKKSGKLITVRRSTIYLKKSMSLFYKLSIETIDTILTAGLPKSAQNLLWHICKLAPYANKTIAITWEEAKQAIGISKATFYRSIRQLTNAGLLISHKIAGFCVSLKNETTVSEMEIKSQNCDSQSQNCDSSLYKEFKILSEGESAKKTENPAEPASKTVAPNSPAMAEVIQTATVDPITLREEKFSAACTKKSTKSFNWLPEGPWSIEGKLDPNFRDWLAQDWKALYLSLIHI